MIKKKPVKKERYNIMVSSNTDARKRPVALSVSKRMLLIFVCALPLFVFGIAAAAVITHCGASNVGYEAFALEKRASVQLAIFDMYSAELGYLRLDCTHDYCSDDQCDEGTALVALEADGIDKAGSMEKKPGEGYVSELAQCLSASGYENTGSGPVITPLVPMTDAIDIINKDFQAGIDASIEAIKASESYDEFAIVYDGDIDGDSYAVSNWADVLSVYAAKTMYEEQNFLSIAPENIGLLRDTYNDMNEVSIDVKKVLQDAVYVDQNTTKECVVLVINVSVNSLTYCEEAEKHDFDRKQKKLLDNLMSPSYYTYFADLLGIDVYDGMRSEELEQIIASLPAGTKGEEIVKTAIIRLGHPYSRGRRGSGNYVDCSYFVWWVYDQAGISLPTSSVEQARYCYNNGYTVSMEELKPGDILFWSKTSCNCGRWREIHHAGLYIGSGKVIDASSCKGRVIIRKLWSGGEWRIAFAARPYEETGDGQTGAAIG